MKITVITPIHGKQKQYGEMIQEIGYKLNEQTIKPFEWIIVCDEKSQWIKNLDIPVLVFKTAQPIDWPGQAI